MHEDDLLFSKSLLQCMKAYAAQTKLKPYLFAVRSELKQCLNYVFEPSIVQTVKKIVFLSICVEYTRIH